MENKTTLNRFIIVILFIFFASLAINFITTGNRRMIILMIVLLASYKTDYKKIIEYTMMMQIIFTSLTTLASVLGLTPNYIVLRPTGEKRYSLGFMYTTNNEYIQMMFKEGIIVAICFIIILSFMLVLLLKKNAISTIFEYFKECNKLTEKIKE